ncbi:MAG: peptide chain release factor N(5)-glutamine methyltransferase [Chitinophagaceae bacterium]|nr:MAG: peptide chain release factor N(5)-glutamine methyltransferase [Chitinophagaceae bacterium]
MSIKESFRRLVQELLPLYSERDATQISDMVFEHVTGLSRLDRITKSGIFLTTWQQQKLDEMGKRLLHHEPAQYVIGEAWFYRLKFKVNKNVLIPRPETEELVTWIIEDIKKEYPLSEEDEKKPLAILDIGTGSGCIAIALKNSMPAWQVLAIDKSKDALDMAKGNALDNQANISFYEMDIMENKHTSSLPQADIIVSNPPYIPFKERTELPAMVKDYEPGMALFVPDDDPLYFYKAIVELSEAKLAEGGRLYFETHQNYAACVAELLKEAHFINIILKKDISGNDRMVRGEKS